MTDYSQVYGELRGRVTRLTRDAGRDALDSIAPATPEWRVRDIVAHLTGVCADVLDGNLDGVATDAWTARHVADRRDRSVEELLAEWEERGGAVEAVINDFPEIAAGQMVTDATTHEHDIRGGLGVPGARESDAVDVAFRWSELVLDASEPLQLESEAGTVKIGEGDPVATVRTSRFELIRSMTGRRSLDQMRAYEWEGEPCPERLVFLIFTPRPTSLVE